MSYREKLNIRKIKLRLNGWQQRGHACRCGYYWLHPAYKEERFSIHEAEHIQSEYRTNIINEVGKK
jgi:hypothetical protein